MQLPLSLPTSRLALCHVMPVETCAEHAPAPMQSHTTLPTGCLALCHVMPVGTCMEHASALAAIAYRMLNRLSSPS